MLMGRGGGQGGLIVDMGVGGGVMQNKKSPDFRFPEFGISAVYLGVN